MCTRLVTLIARRIGLLLFSTLLSTFVVASSTDSSNKKILIMGDSISAGHGFSIQQAWPTLLQQKLNKYNCKFDIINASISGETSHGGLARLPRLLQLHKPHFVLIELGGNDALRGQPLNILSDNLRKMIVLSKNSDAVPLLIGMKIPPNYGPQYSDAFFKIYQDLAEETDVSLIPFLLKNVALNSDLMQEDGIHPTAEAQPTIMHTVWNTLYQLLADSSAIDRSKSATELEEPR